MEFNVKRFSELTVSEIYEILKARYDIFTVEKGMCCRDIDGLDYNALHCVLTDGNKLIGYLRAVPYDGCVRLGRVITLEHGRGYGRELIKKSVTTLRRDFGYTKITVHAQHDAVGFYQKCGFTQTSNAFMESDVVHYAMELV